MAQDFSKRLVVVVRNDLQAWEAANAVAHISAYFGNKIGASFGTGDSFVTQDGKEYPRNTQYPIIIKSAKGSTELQPLLEAAREGNYMHLAFIREMIETTDDSEIEATLAQKADAAVELLGVGVFGEHEEMKALTKKFDLWK